MQIEYKNNRIAKICTNIYEAEKIHLRIKQISAALSIDMLLKYNIGRCHQLKGSRKKQYAMDLVHPYRLVFEKKDNEIEIAYIMEIVDYH